MNRSLWRNWRCRKLAILRCYRRCRRCRKLAILRCYRWLRLVRIYKVNVSVNILSVEDLLHCIFINEINLAEIYLITELHEEICEFKVYRAEWLCRLLDILCILCFFSLCLFVNLRLFNILWRYRRYRLLVSMEVNVNLFDLIPVLKDSICKNINAVSIDECTDLFDELCYIEDYRRLRRYRLLCFIEFCIGNYELWCFNFYCFLSSIFFNVLSNSCDSVSLMKI